MNLEIPQNQPWCNGLVTGVLCCWSWGFPARHGGTPSQHPFIDPIVPYKSSSYWGTPTYGNRLIQKKCIPYELRFAQCNGKIHMNPLTSALMCLAMVLFHVWKKKTSQSVNPGFFLVLAAISSIAR